MHLQVLQIELQISFYKCVTNHLMEQNSDLFTVHKVNFSFPFLLVKSLILVEHKCKFIILKNANVSLYFETIPVNAID